MTYKQLIQLFHVVTTSFMHFDTMLHSSQWLKSTNAYVVGHELPLAAHGVEQLQQARPQQALRRDGRPSRPAVELLEFPVHGLQHGVGEQPGQP